MGRQMEDAGLPTLRIDMILSFLSQLGSECSLFENCARVSFPADFLWWGLLMLMALGLTTFLKEA